MRKEAAVVPATVAPSAPAVVRPNEPAAITHPLPPTRSTDSLDLRATPMPAPHVPPIKETPNLNDRSAQMPATEVLPATFEPAGATPQSRSVGRRRAMSRPLIAVLVGLPILLVLGFASVIVARWFINRRAVENAPIQSASTATDHAMNETKAADVPTKRFFTGDFNEGKALELIYGSYDYQKKYAKWKLTAEDLRKSHVDTEGSGITPGTVYTNANFFQSFTQAGVQRYFLITDTVPARYDCHACAPMIGGAIFSQVGSNWQLEAQNRIISTMGSFGSAPKGKLIKIGPDRQGAMFEAGGMGQGISNEVVVVIADIGETLSEVLTVDEFGGDNGGACGEGLATCYSFSSKLEFVPGANPDYYDARVTTTGTKEDDNGKVQRVNAVKKYSFANGKYAPAK